MTVSVFRLSQADTDALFIVYTHAEKSQQQPASFFSLPATTVGVQMSERRHVPRDAGRHDQVQMRRRVRRAVLRDPSDAQECRPVVVPRRRRHSRPSHRGRHPGVRHALRVLQEKARRVSLDSCVFRTFKRLPLEFLQAIFLCSEDNFLMLLVFPTHVDNFLRAFFLRKLRVYNVCLMPVPSVC